MNSLSFKLGELADIVGGKVEGDSAVEIQGVAGIREAKAGDITFIANPKYEAIPESESPSAVPVKIRSPAQIVIPSPATSVGSPGW